MKPQLHFYDAAAPENVPSGVHAGVYINGFAWPQSQVDRMAKVFRISVHHEAYYARIARCIDVENGAAMPTDVVPFIKYRRAHLKAQGHRGDDATAYVNRSNWSTVVDLVHQAGIEQPLYWVATLDGTQELEGNPWAVQYATIHGAYDLSVLHGVDNFRKP